MPCIIHHAIYFANINYFREAIDALVTKKGKELTTIILNFTSINNIDSSAVHMLEDLVDVYKLEGIQILFTDIKGPVRDAMRKAKLMDKIGWQRCFINVPAAVDFSLDKTRTKKVEFQNYVLQSNQ